MHMHNGFFVYSTILLLRCFLFIVRYYALRGRQGFLR
jgi:hypothetical protein